ncbi:SusC/RagA family TonB-linked outer membrane protein [Spirosoma sp. HMF3257]|uniref:SusC/RagA family TonB-linked outer membrane protein n=2 Tax=Spirosoma telluris TaxID=2183553 RepID=A0A327NTL2_9BACT|nr:SusC/RagA family TonB-linked outer membrane protein [Spirosoma telluris]RAI78731.1 SusC/RagA family TonB-linked outer membrane protein [Spirosoma telluris]
MPHHWSRQRIEILPLRQLSVAFLFCLLSGLSALAQTVTGRIVSGDDNQPLPGVSIVVKGTNAGTTSRADGTYSINTSSKNTLTFSFIGYATQEIAVGNRTILDVTMQAGDRTLDEVVVTALGIKKDIRQTGVAIQTVDGSQLLKAREPNPINSLTGKIAGLTIGASAELLGRPSVTLRGNQDVLFVVDGIPITSDTWNISADDIDTYTVLKGASASALYGFRGKNGAILITTKRGSKDKRGFSVEVNTSQMVDQGFIALPKVQDEYGPGDHGVYAFGDGKGNGLNDGDYDIWGPKFSGQLIPQYDSPVVPGQTFTTTFPNGASFTSNRQPTPYVARGKDNLTRFIQAGILSNNNITVGATGDKYDLRFSLSHNYQRGLVPNTKLNVTNFNITGGYNFSPKLRFESSLNYNRQYTPNFPDVSYGPNSLIYNIVIWGGADWNIDDMKQIWQPGKEGTQQIYAEYQRYNNPWFLAKYWLRGHYNNNLYGYASLKYQLADGLQLTGRIQATTYSLLRTEKFPYSATVYGREEARGDYREDRRNLFDNINQVLLQYNKKVTPALSINALAGGEARIFNYNTDYASTNYLNVPGVYTLGNSSNPVQGASFQSDMRVLSAYYSADFSFRDYATLTTTGRLDKLSTLPKGNDAYFYPSVALSTVLSDYIDIPAQTGISFLKLRASYANVKDGLTQSTIQNAFNPFSGYGSNPLGYGDNYTSSYGGPTYQNSAVYSIPLAYNNKPAAYYTNTLSNPNLKPNSTSQAEVGLDIRFLNNRLALDGAYYISNDGPRIFTLPSSEATGYTGRLVNGIKTQKKGGEISLTGKVIRSPKGFNWDIVANYSTYKETLKEVYPAGGINTLASNYFVSGSSDKRYINIGDRTDGFYSGAFVRTQDGQIINDYSQGKDAAGNIVYSGGRPIVNPVAQFLGYVNPKFVWGINNRFNYKNWNFSFQFDGRVGGVIVDYIKQKTYQGGRNIETIQGALGAARDNDALGVKSYLSEGVVNIAVDEKGNQIPINYDVNGNITNYSQLKFAPNPLKTFEQDYIGRVYGQSEASLISRSFAKLREVVIGYTLPQKLLKPIGVKQASVSVVGRNLLYFAERTDVDLDQFVTGGRSDLQTPTTRRYGFNLNLTF